MSTRSIAKYASVFNIGLQNTFVYRWNYFLRALFALIPLAGTVFLWAAVFKERGGGLHGYDYGSMIYYYLLTILISNLVVPTEDDFQIAADIREGQINALLTKPMSYLAYRTSIFLSGRLVYSFVTLPPIAVIFHPGISACAQQQVVAESHSLELEPACLDYDRSSNRKQPENAILN